MKTPRLFDATGRPLKLGDRIGKGGEGEVYRVADNDNLAIKFYTVSDLQSRRDKILAMISAELAGKTPLVAFPISIVKNDVGAFAGFIMTRVSGHEPLHELYSPAARKSSFPNADYRFLVRSAANLARAVASVHQAGCIIGDVNHSGILISAKATVTLIDADSFQITNGSAQYLCKVGVPEYTPPELQGLSLDSLARTTNHDNFGLAVAIFQILWMGRHPFSGRFQSPGDMPMEKAIKEMRFAYSVFRAVGMSPPPAVPLLRDFPLQVKNAFETAFGPSGVTLRPTAAQWIDLLRDLEQNLRVCKDNVLHHYPTEAQECPWCRMERLQGVQLFVSSQYRSSDENAGNGIFANVAAIWAAIEKIAAPNDATLKPVLPTLTLQPSAAVSKHHSDLLLKKLSGGGLIIAGIAIFAAVRSLMAIGVGMIIWGTILLFSDTKVRSGTLARARDIETNWLKALYDWEERCGAGEFNALKDQLARTRQAIADLPNKERRLLADYQQNRQREQLKLYLEKFRIRQFKIKGIGPSKLSTLTSFGIETAADVSEFAVLQVPGFGPVNSASLLSWQKGLVARFVYDPRPNSQDKVFADRIRADNQREASQLRAKLANGPDELKKIGQAIESRRRALDPMLLRLHEQRMQLHTDLKAIGLAPPSVTPPPRPVHSPAPARQSPIAAQPRPSVSSPSSAPRTGAPSCPTCGSGMTMRHARRGRHVGRPFWGCNRFPRCTGTRNI